MRAFSCLELCNALWMQGERRALETATLEQGGSDQAHGEAWCQNPLQHTSNIDRSKATNLKAATGRSGGSSILGLRCGALYARESSREISTHANGPGAAATETRWTTRTVTTRTTPMSIYGRCVHRITAKKPSRRIVDSEIKEQLDRIERKLDILIQGLAEESLEEDGPTHGLDGDMLPNDRKADELL